MPPWRSQGEWQSHSLCMPARRKPRQPPPQRRNTPPGKRSEAPARRSAADRQTQASGSEGRRGGARSGARRQAPPKAAGSPPRGGHTRPTRAPGQAPTPQAARGAGGRKRTPEGGRPCAPPPEPQRRPRSGAEQRQAGQRGRAGGASRRRRGRRQRPPERPPVYGGPSNTHGRGADYDTPLPLGVHCSLFIEKTKHVKLPAYCGHVGTRKRTLDVSQAPCYTGSRCQYYQYRHRDLCEVAHASPSSIMLS